MPAIERVIPLVAQLPASMREALLRRLRELLGLGLIALSGVAAGGLVTWAGADDLVGAGSEPQPRDVARDPQRRRLSRRDRRRPLDADSGPGRHHADPADRGVGLAHADPPRLRRRSVAAWRQEP